MAMAAVQLRPTYTFLPSMLADMTARAAQLEAALAGSANGLSKTLWVKGQAGSLQGGIITLEYDSVRGSFVPASEFKITRISNSQFGIQDASSPTTGLTRILKPGHLITATSGFVTIRDTSAQVNIAETAAWTRVGDTLTFLSDPGTTATEDFYHVERTCELGELRNDGQWILSGNGARAAWKDGLHIPTDTFAVSLFHRGVSFPWLGNSGTIVAPKMVSVASKVDIDQSGWSTNCYFCVGYYGAVRHCVAGPYQFNPTEVRRSLVFNLISSPTVSVSPFGLGDPGNTTMDLSLSVIPGDTGTRAFSFQPTWSGVTPDVAFNGQGTDLSMAMTAVIAGARVGWRLITAGSTEATVTELEICTKR